VKKVGLVAAILLAGIAVWFLVGVGSVWLRLHRNQPAAESLARGLNGYLNSKPYQARGTASYERDVIYIEVSGRPDKAKQEEIRNWLSREKQRRGIDARGLLRFPDPKTGDYDAELDF
jgi:hypothetical protein